MADLEETLHALLSDPETMGQLQALASQLGLDGAAPSEDGEEAPGQTPSPPPFDLEEIGRPDGTAAGAVPNQPANRPPGRCPHRRAAPLSAARAAAEAGSGCPAGRPLPGGSPGLPPMESG